MYHQDRLEHPPIGGVEATKGVVRECRRGRALGRSGASQ